MSAESALFEPWIATNPDLTMWKWGQTVPKLPPRSWRESEPNVRDRAPIREAVLDVFVEGVSGPARVFQSLGDRVRADFPDERPSHFVPGAMAGVGGAEAAHLAQSEPGQSRNGVERLDKTGLHRSRVQNSRSASGDLR